MTAGWKTRAACRGMDVEAFFPHQSGDHFDAIRACLRCGVRRQCAQFALDMKLRYGIYGGVLTSQPHAEAALRAVTESAAPLSEARDSGIRCEGCGRMLRPARTTKQDYPGSVIVKAAKRCAPCFAKYRTEVTA